MGNSQANLSGQQIEYIDPTAIKPPQKKEKNK